MVLVAERTERLDKFLARMLPDHSRSRLVKLIDEGEVTVDGSTTKASFLLGSGMEVVLDEPANAAPHDLTPADIPLEIVFEDEFLLVVNKPRGLASHPAASLKEPSLVNALLARNTPLSSTAGEFRPGIVHRLDKETTGLMVVAKTDQAHVLLARQIESKSAERRYFAVVAGNLAQPRFTINAPIARSQKNRLLMTVDPHGKPAVTHIKQIARVDQGYVVGCRLETGRTHQIRVHLRAVGYPVLGDTLYAPKEWATGPLQLHAAYLSFAHPVSEDIVSFYAAPDAEFYGQAEVSLESIDPF